MQVGLLFLLIFGMTTAVSAQDIDLTNDSTPTLVGESDHSSVNGKAGNGNDETPGEWYAGDEPENPVSNAPVLLRSEEHTSELQSRGHLVCRLLLEKQK